jgi:hypothetical protein
VNRTVTLAWILAVGGVLEIGTGLGLLVAPSAVVSLLLRSRLDGAGLTIARVAGGALLALGIACWSARVAPATPAGLGVSWGFLAYNLVACAMLALARPPLAGGLAALGASIFHGLLAAALLGALFGGAPPDRHDGSKSLR